MPQIPLAADTLLLGREVNSYNILANGSEYFPSANKISAKAFSNASNGPRFCGSETRVSKICAVFLQTSGTECGVLITFSRRSIALNLIREQQTKLYFFIYFQNSGNSITELTHHLSLASRKRQSILISTKL